jgi:hypothetical protein
LRVLRPSWSALEALISRAKREVVVCSPYITRAGVGRIFDALKSSTSVRVMTRLSPSDWASGVSSPEEVLALLELWSVAGGARLDVIQRLHAKLYAADSQAALVGSANLSEGGFDHNVELAVEMSGDDASEAIRVLDEHCAPHCRQVSLADLRRWIEESREEIERVGAAAAAQADRLASCQASLDRMLSFGVLATTGMTPDPEIGELDDFIEWIEAHHDLPGAEETILRHRGKHQLMGHVKQSFFACVRFFRDHPDLIQVSAGTLSNRSRDEVVRLDPSVHETWLDHIDSHAGDVGEHYAYPTLRVILPPSLGGTCQGGGGSSTLKRVLPLVAAFLKEGNR